MHVYDVTNIIKEKEYQMEVGGEIKGGLLDGAKTNPRDTQTYLFKLRVLECIQSFSESPQT